MQDNLRLTVSALFDVFSIEFATTLPTTEKGKRFVQITVENITGRPFAIFKTYATADVVAEFVKREIIHTFWNTENLSIGQRNLLHGGNLANGYEIIWYYVE